MIDIIYISNNKLYTKSKLFKRQHAIDKERNTNHGALKKITEKYKKCISIYSRYLGSDTTGWIIKSFISEIMEFILQSQALLLYNGYHLFDSNNKNDVYLANKPEYINLFAIILSFNCFGSGILWLSYSLCSKRFHGLVFKLSIYFVDQFSDLLYTIFPFIIIFTDDYNQNSQNPLVLLGQLNLSSTLAFFAAFAPLFLSCNKCLFVLSNAIQEMRNNYYQKWKDIQCVIDDEKESPHSSANKHVKSSWIEPEKSNKSKCIWKIILMLMSIIYIVFGVSMILWVRHHIGESTHYCSSVTESTYFSNNTFSNNSVSLEKQQILQTNAELFYWDNCLYKTYPFVSNNKYKCQCRVFVIDWTNLHSTSNEREKYFNLTQSKLLRGMLEHWIMLEKFRTVGSESAYYVDHILSSSMFKAVHMKAFEWKQSQIKSVEDGISSWKKLEYLKFEETNGIHVLPADFHKLEELKYLSFIFSGLEAFTEQICDLTQLKVLQIQWNPIKSIPKCVANLVDLRQLLIDVNVLLTDVPLSIFTLPNLIDLSLFQSLISYESILEYNLPDNMTINDTENWFNDNFKWNDLQQTSYWLSKNPICENVDTLPIRLQEFINQTNTCYYPCTNTDALRFEGETSFCIPMQFGDGRCDKLCNFDQCYMDNGDCAQLCFSELTNCSWDKFTNNKCDEGCDNDYCKSYVYGSNFGSTVLWRSWNNVYATDMHQCPIQSKNVSTCTAADHELAYENYTITEACKRCMKSESIYINSSNYATPPKCKPHYISDGLCDDSCRTDECDQDGGDCNSNCIDDYCHSAYTAWTFVVGTSNYKIEHIDFCENWWELLDSYFGLYESKNDCYYQVKQYDYNNDQWMNFREFVAMALELVSRGHFLSEQVSQVNCSACIGVHNYIV